VQRQEPRGGAIEVDHDQSIHGRLERRVDAEGQELSPQLDVLFHQDRQALLIGLELRHAPRELAHVDLQGLAARAELHGVQRPHARGQCMAMRAATQARGDQVSRTLAVTGRDADRSEQPAVARARREQMPDTPPEHRQHSAAALQLGAHEGAPELHGRAELIEKARSKLEQAARVQPGVALLAPHHVRHAQPIRTEHLLAARLPNEQLLIPVVVLVEVARLAGALPDGAEGQLAQATDLVHHVRDRMARRHQHHVITARVQGMHTAQRLDLTRQLGGVFGRCR
jgi:hypothetical protein